MSNVIETRLVVGSTWDWSVMSDDYSAANGWSLKLYLVPRFASPVQAPIVIDSVAASDGVSHRFQRTAVQSGAYKSGQYGFHANAVKGSEVYTLGGTYWTGEVTLFPNPADLTQGADSRSQAQKAVDDIRMALANAVSLASSANTSMMPVQISIGDRTTTFANPREAIEALRSELSMWSVQLANEMQRAAGRPAGPLGRISYGVPN